MVQKQRSCQKKQLGFYLKSIRASILKLGLFHIGDKTPLIYLSKGLMVNLCLKAGKLKNFAANTNDHNFEIGAHIDFK